jgi:hypothetical protein
MKNDRIKSDRIKSGRIKGDRIKTDRITPVATNSHLEGETPLVLRRRM